MNAAQADDATILERQATDVGQDKSPRAIVEEGSKKRARPCLYFTIDAAEFPPDTGFDHDIEVGLVSLRGDEELDAMKNSDGNQASVSIELCKIMFRSWDGRRVKIEEGEQEVLWEQMGPKARNLMMSAFQEVWVASPKAVQKQAKSFRWGKV